MVAAEREIKLVVDRTLELPAIDELLDGGATARPRPRKQQEADYYDTADLRLARWGCSLRYRSDDGWTVKLPGGVEGAVLVRGEVHVEPDGSEPPIAAVDLVSGFSRDAALGVVARVETNRYPVDLLDPGGGVLAELVDDDVTTTGPSGERARFREIEIELAAGVSDAEVSSLVDRLVDRGARPSTSSKVLLALGGPDAAPTEVPAPDLGAKPTAREVVEAAIARSVRAIVLNLPGVRLGEDDEAVHQARVGTRRLRSDLRTFRPLLDRDWARELTDELRWLGDALGKVRDLDVMLITLADVIATERSVTPADAAQLIEVLEAERDDRRRALLEALGTTRAFELLDVLIDASQNPMTEPEADEPATDVLPRLVRKPWRRIERAVDRLDAESPDEELHAVRILAKRCRYAAEAVRPAAGKNAKRFAKAMSNVQDCLGELNDAVLISNHLRRTAAADPETAYVAGQLSGILAVRAHRTAAAFWPVWQEASKQRLRRWW